MTQPRPVSDLIDITAVAQRLGVQVRHVRRLVHERRIPYIKWGHLLRFDPADIDTWIDRSRRGFAGQRVAAIDRAAVRAFVAEMRRNGYAPKTIRSTILVLKLVLDLPLEDKVIFENPAVRQKLGSGRRREPIFLSAEQLDALAAAAGQPWTALILFAGYTGLRPAELAGLKVKRLDLLRGRVEVRETLTLVNGSLNEGPTKTYEARSVPLPLFLREVLAAHLAERGRGGGPPTWGRRTCLRRPPGGSSAKRQAATARDSPRS